MPVIAAIGTAVPPHTIAQTEVRDFARTLFGDAFRDIDRLLTVFASAQIEKRHLAAPIEWYTQDHSFADKNRLYIEQGVTLATTAIHNCLDQAGLQPEDIDHLVFVSSTGLATPSLDAHLFNALGLSPNLKRTPIWGLGCAGGAAGLARGFDLALAHPDSKVVVCALELCSLTFLRADRSKSNLIATSLFADGCAAMLVLGTEAAKRHPSLVAGAPRVLASRSTIWPETLDVMGWELQEAGLKVIFSKDIPSIVESKIRPQIETFLQESGLDRADMKRFIAHPGGMKVLQAYQEALDLPDDLLRHSRDVLRTHGNMSSCTVLFALARELQDAHQAGEHGLLLALGPGFSCEQVLLRW
ncbi:type III polyketide synthase [Tumebacillus permanentifrigoris]|uniref:15-methylpalmitoyl-4-hydroxy-2-pyrone synthase n=1 Tax=Tumebacillus permanentifrigoris TaxID=378543 RepID=A0A316D8S3_9BACL|nr:3-oxoacyl-[acyl-carrier-protein] synthase III C-terminal domain-containing protein [Tumebacillus permanentifrigoris]PWK13376.1 15-methylpalmitoyl-4-hydroxy-2-pyrone synthase [Tumebacillus permanentifrigoris]